MAEQSYREALASDAFVLDQRDGQLARDAIAAGRLERFIGVVYSPGSERLSHYYQMEMAHQFDPWLLSTRARRSG